MKFYGIGIILLFAVSCMAGPKKEKPAKLMPPAQSHGMAISGYGCDRQQAYTSTSEMSSAFWSLLVWAKYGKDHKKDWQKTYGTYRIDVKNALKSSGESAGSGAVIGGMGTESYDFTPLEKDCTAWSAQVKSTLKIDPNGEAVKR